VCPQLADDPFTALSQSECRTHFAAIHRRAHRNRPDGCHPQAEVLIGQGRTVAEACREIGVTEVTYCRSFRCSTSGCSA
jgi:hypothetical protein